MKKICLVSFCNMYLLPYAKIYIDKIINHNYKCDLLFWDRDDSEDNSKDILVPGCNVIKYSKKLNADSNILTKINGYISARKFIAKKLKENKYDGVVFLQTHAAVFLNNIIKKFYKKKYIVDIRDYSLENFWYYRKIESKLLNMSYGTVISSPAYEKFLPKQKYVLAHNFVPFKSEEVENNKNLRNSKHSNKVEISFVGTVRFIENDKKILDLFSNNPKYQINYFGVGSDILKNYCEKRHILNCSFKGKFAPKDTVTLYNTTSIINNLYGNNSNFLNYALSNKLYHAIQLNIPILVSPNTYMEEIVNKYKLGFVLDLNNNNCIDDLYTQYSNFDFQLFEKNCKLLLDKVIEDNEVFYTFINSFLKNV